MPTPDDELRDVFVQGRAADRANAPSFDETWAAAQQKKGAGLRVAVAIAVAAAVLLIAGWVVIGGDSGAGAPVAPPDEKIAETNPLPDIPNDEAPDVAEEGGLAALAAWEPTLETPTDFLLEDDGVLGGGMPSSDLSDSVLDLDDFTMEL